MAFARSGPAYQHVSDGNVPDPPTPSAPVPSPQTPRAAAEPRQMGSLTITSLAGSQSASIPAAPPPTFRAAPVPVSPAHGRSPPRNPQNAKPSTPEARSGKASVSPKSASASEIHLQMEWVAADRSIRNGPTTSPKSRPKRQTRSREVCVPLCNVLC